MSLQEHGFARKDEFVMVIFFMYSSLDHKCCTVNMILYSIPKVKDLLVAFLKKSFSLPEYHFRFAYKVECRLSWRILKAVVKM